MRIRSQLLLAAAAAAVVALGVIGSLWSITQQNAATLRGLRDGQEIARDLASLLTLTLEHTAYGGDRPVAQWHARHAQLMKIMDQAVARESPPHPSLVEMRQRVQDLAPLYSGLVEALRDGSSGLAQRRREVMIERMVSETQDLVEARHRLALAFVAGQAHQQRVLSWIVLVASGILTLLIVGLAVQVTRRGLRPLAKLQAATAAIQRGDLSVRCDSGGHDELADTARAVNAMAESLLAANASLRQSEERFALALQASNEGILDYDIVHDRVYSSPRAMRIMGIASDVTVRSRSEWRTLVAIHPDDVQRVDADFQRLLDGRSEFRDCEYRVLLPDGEHRWIHHRSICIRDAEGRPVRTAASLSDIDARKRAEEHLRQSEERYALAMTGSNEAHWVWDVATDEMHASSILKEMFGIPAEEVLKTRTAYLNRMPIAPEDRERIAHAWAELLAGTQQRLDIEYRIVDPTTGATRWIHTRGQCFRDDAGRATRVAGATVEVTERKNAEEQRRQLEDRLRQAQKLEAIGTLAGGIAHDFNNILAAILGYGEMAQKDVPEGSPLRKHIDAALNAGLRAKSLVERILAFSRSGMGERVPVHVQSVVDEALVTLAASLPSRVHLVRRLEAGDAGVMGDPTQIHQVVMNLCANAAQAMQDGGTLEVTLDVASLDEPLALATSTLPPGEFLRLTVADTGSGIEPSLLGRIFDPFFTTKEVGVGTGLGLSLVHGIVTDLGGGIAVQSGVGQGSRFTCYLPCQVRVPVPAAPASSAVARGNGQTVLLVDDEVALVRLGEETLAELGYEPVGFASSTAALQAFREDPDRFDVLVSDEAMPGMTGSELVRAVHAVRPGLPVLLMSGFVTPALAQRAREIGVTEVLGKPLSAKDLARSLAEALETRGAGSLVQSP